MYGKFYRDAKKIKATRNAEKKAKLEERLERYRQYLEEAKL